MKVVARNSRSGFEKILEEGLKEAQKDVVRLLTYVGEACINEARTNGNYTDRTGNLRSSIGYVVVVDGKVWGQGQASQTLDGADGQEEARSYMDELVAQVQNDRPTLIVVAGMEYATYVADRNYNVLESAETLAQKMIQQLLK